MATSSNDHNNATDFVPCTTTLTDIPSPETFYNDYVKKRRPVLLKDCCGRVTPKLMAATCSLDKLVDIVGRDAVVQVNQRKNDTGTQLHAFSPLNSTVINMKFGHLVDKLQQGSTQYYMTTQTLPLNEEGQPALYTTPVTQLVQQHHMDTLRPLMLGNLIPMTYNLWIGQATTTKPQSSGLHHDYNDNLYCLLEGNKTFQIAPPSSIVKLQTRGTLHTLHDNGRIVYQEQVQESGRIRPDGALESVERIMQLELRQEEVEAKLEATNDTVQQEELQAELDAIQEELLDLEMEGETDGPNDDNENLLFGGTKNTFNIGDGDEDESDEEESEDAPNPKRARLDDDDDDDDDGAEDREDGVPLNFVVKDPDFTLETIEMNKGDLLYLPAGWFHQVLSKGGLHIAFNYWMHPPDVSDDTSFEVPYRSKFWQRDWESRPESKLD